MHVWQQPNFPGCWQRCVNLSSACNHPGRFGCPNRSTTQSQCLEAHDWKKVDVSSTPCEDMGFADDGTFHTENSSDHCTAQDVPIQKFVLPPAALGCSQLGERLYVLQQADSTYCKQHCVSITSPCNQPGRSGCPRAATMETDCLAAHAWKLSETASGTPCGDLGFRVDGTFHTDNDSDICTAQTVQIKKYVLPAAGLGCSKPGEVMYFRQQAETGQCWQHCVSVTSFCNRLGSSGCPSTTTKEGTCLIEHSWRVAFTPTPCVDVGFNVSDGTFNTHEDSDHCIGQEVPIAKFRKQHSAVRQVVENFWGFWDRFGNSVLSWANKKAR